MSVKIKITWLNFCLKFILRNLRKFRHFVAFISFYEIIFFYLTLRRIRDFAHVKADGAVTLALAKAGLSMLRIDELGLDTTDIRLLTAMTVKFGGRAVGLETLAAATGEDPRTI